MLSSSPAEQEATKEEQEKEADKDSSCGGKGCPRPAVEYGSASEHECMKKIVAELTSAH